MFVHISRILTTQRLCLEHFLSDNFLSLEIKYQQCFVVHFVCCVHRDRKIVFFSIETGAKLGEKGSHVRDIFSLKVNGSILLLKCLRHYNMVLIVLETDSDPLTYDILITVTVNIPL